jgi:hypothetical protein
MERFCIYCGQALTAWERDSPSCQSCRDAIIQGAHAGDLYIDSYEYENAAYDYGREDFKGY